MKPPTRRNAWMPSWFGDEQTRAWEELPLCNGKVAPHTEAFREEYRVWYRKWNDKYPRPCIQDDYNELDRQKEKHLSERSSSGYR